MKLNTFFVVGGLFASLSAGMVYAQSSDCKCASSDPEQLKKCIDDCKPRGSMTVTDSDGNERTINFDSAEKGGPRDYCESTKDCKPGLECKNNICVNTD